MKRRSLLAGILAASIAPAIVRADSLMKIYVPKIWVPWLGVSEFTAEGFFKGNLVDEFRITKGVGRYNENFEVALPVDKWTHIAVTSAGLFVNGVLKRTGPKSKVECAATNYLIDTARPYLIKEKV